jgi:hypothetical protein
MTRGEAIAYARERLSEEWTIIVVTDHAAGSVPTEVVLEPASDGGQTVRVTGFGSFVATPRGPRDGRSDP